MTISEANQQLVEDLKQVGRDAEVLAKAAVGEAGEKAKAIRNRLSAALESAKATCERFGGELQSQAVQTARRTDRVIRQYPYESIGIAFGVGLLIGVLVGRR